MNRKFISVFMIGAATLASLGTVTSCKDYDDDIDNLQERIDASGVDLKAEVSRLQGLLDDCKSACETADEKLNEAIKNATNDAKGYADIQAAEANKAAVEAAQKLIEEAISDLESGAVKAAQAKADEAYTLAEQVSKLAADNEANIKKVVNQLSEAKANLEKADAELDKRLTDAEKKLAEAEKQVERNKADIIKTNTALSSLKDSNEKAQKALSEKDDELKKLIDDNQAAIEKLLDEKVKALTDLTDANKAAIEALDKTVKANKDEADQAVKDAAADAQAKLDAAVIKLDGTIQSLKDKDIKDLKDAIDVINGENGYKALIENLKNGDIKTLQNDYTKLTAEDGPIEKNAAAIKALQEKDIKNINSYLDILEANLNNLITSLILQDEQLEIVQAQVVSDVNKTGISGKQFTEVRGTKTYVWFPYKGADNANDDLIAGKWNVEREAGNVYYTINPTNVNFTDQANINIENSLAAAPDGIDISAPKGSERKSPITRAAAEDKAPANGLYQSSIKNTKNHLDAAHPGFANSYALFTSYKQTGKDNKVTEKKVYSQYALNINVTAAGEQTAPSIVAVGADASHPATCDARFVADYGEDLNGTFNLLPQNTELGKTGATPKVYRKYVEAIAVSNSRNEAQTGNTLTTLLKAINEKNAGVLNTIFEEDNEGFDQISVTIPDNAGSYSFVGSTVTFRYFIQNYNGTIYSKEIKVMFTKTLFNEKGMDIEHTPYASGDNDTKHGLNQDSKTDFQTEANCISVAASNTLWYKNTSKIEVEATDGLKIKTIEFRSNAKTPTWVNETAIATINMNKAAKASVDGLTQTSVQKIKNMTITYDPADLDVEKEYNLVMNSYDLNGNLVSRLPIKFTMKYPNHHAELIKPNPAYFTPYDKNATTVEKIAGKTLTAWANDHKDVSPASAPGTVYDATYNIISAFNAPYNNADGCVISFDYTDKADYTQTNSKYKAFKPVNDWRLNFSSAATDYTMEVPSVALKDGAEHVYTLQVAVENFGVASLWYNPTVFSVVFKSAIAHADFAFNKDLYEVEYPSHDITIGDVEITSDDPSTSTKDDITYFGAGRDNRIKATSVKLIDTQFQSLFKTVEITTNGIHIVTNETVPGGVGSITTDAVTFGFYVTDYYGNTKEYKFNVKVKENKN